MALHTTSEYDVTVQPAAQPVPELCVSYSGAGMAFATALSSCVHGGQVVLSESAWEQVKPTMVSHPGKRLPTYLHTHTHSFHAACTKLLQSEPNVHGRTHLIVCVRASMRVCVPTCVRVTQVRW